MSTAVESKYRGIRNVRARRVLLVAALAIAYLLAAELGFRGAFSAEQVSAVWPPSGIALWAVLHFGWSIWPAVWLGAFAANGLTHMPPWCAAVVAVGNTLEPITGAWLLRRFSGVRRSIERLPHVIGVVTLAAAASTTISATIGVAALCIAHVQSWDRFWTLWWIWWLGDGTGVLVVTPALVTAGTWLRLKGDRSRITEALAMLAAMIAVSVVVFGMPMTTFTMHHPLEYAVFPIIMWAALRFAHPGTALVSVTLSSIAVAGTIHGLGPFSGDSVASRNEALILLQVYIGVTVASGLVLGAAIAERNRAERLRETDHAITQILTGKPDHRAAAPAILQAVCQTLDWDLGIMWRVDPANDALQYVESWRSPDAELDAFIETSRRTLLRRGLGLPGRVWASGRPAAISDVVTDTNFPRSASANSVGLHGAFAFPILSGQQVHGVLEFFSRSRRDVDDKQLRLMVAIGTQLGQFLERERVEEQAARSEARKAAIIDVALDSIISIDAAGRITAFNPAATRTLGFEADAVIGRELAEVIIPARLRDRHRAALRRCVETGESRILDRRVEMPAVRADGTEFPVELAITRIPGPLLEFTAHMRDITERKQVEQERADSLAREQAARLAAEGANRLKDEFLATVSHELRTPLNAILGWATMLKTRHFSAERIQEIYETIHRNAAAQAQLINDLLDVSRIVVGQLRLQFQRVDLTEIARLSVESIRPTAEAKGVALQADTESATGTVYGDAARIQQIIWNLLSNAVKFTPRGGSVLVSVKRASTEVEVVVRDTGVGIVTEFLPHLFERFRQADSGTTRSYGGLGLGLAIVRHLVELHGGEIHGESAGRGQGSTFTVRFPAHVETQAGRTTTAAATLFPEAASTARLDGLTVLIVDDDPDARFLVATILEGQGARVLSAGSVADAVEVFWRDRPDVLIVDIGLSEEDGFALLRKIRAEEARQGQSSTPAIALTAYASPGYREQTSAAGFAGHLIKPLLPDVLIATLTDLQGRPG